MTDGQTSFTFELPKINTWVTSLGSRMLLILSYLFDQKVKKKIQKKIYIFIRIYWKRGLQRATTNIKHLLQIELPKINTWVTSLGSRMLLILSYLFDQKVKKKIQKKIYIFIRIYWKRGLQRATTKNTLVLQILSEYLIRVRQTHSF